MMILRCPFCESRRAYIESDVPLVSNFINEENRWESIGLYRAVCARCGRHFMISDKM